MKNTRVQDVDVLILGAGISGLAAAHVLSKKKNLTFAVIEARDRIGGRIWTTLLPRGLTAEHGAEWIGATHKNLLRLCKELGVKLEPHRFPGYPYMKNGTPDPILPALLERLESVLQRTKRTRGLDKVSLLKFLNKHFSPKEVVLLRTMYSAEFAEDARYVSAIRAILDHMTGGKNSHMDFHVKGGNTKLINALAHAVGAHNVHLGQEVESVTQTQAGVVVECANGAVWCAKKVICTLPTQVLARTHFSPALPITARRAAENLKYGNIVKVMLTFPSRFWGKDNFSLFSGGPAQYVFHTTQGQRGPAGTLCIYAVGARADQMSAMNKSQAWSALKRALPAEMRTKGIAPTHMTRHVWANDRFVTGAYAVYQPGEWARVGRAFGKPFHHVYFAGEHLAALQGFMEGAATTGIAQAKEVIKLLRT